MYRGNLDLDLNELKQLVIHMGTRVESTISQAMLSLKERNIEKAQYIIDTDIQTNKIEEEIMNLGAKIIATQQPVAKDMRRILIAFRIANDLERMADLAVDIAKLTKRMGDTPLIKPLVDIPKLGDVIENMVTESIESYIQEDVDLAYKMAQTDDVADQLFSQILGELFVLMNQNPETVKQGMLLCFVARHLERIADYATNIGEDVVYLVSGDRPDLN